MIFQCQVLVCPYSPVNFLLNIVLSGELGVPMECNQLNDVARFQIMLFTLEVQITKCACLSRNAVEDIVPFPCHACELQNS